MEKEEYNKIKGIIDDFKNHSNNDLKLAMDVLSEEFEKTKQLIIDFTFYLDNVEDTHNKILKEYKQRTNT
jgi:hypothetical protein